MKASEMMLVLLDALNEELIRDGSRDELCSLTIQSGNAVVIDYGTGEGCAGMGWIRLVSSAPTVRFPAADVSVDNCMYSLAHVIEMGLMRPSPLPDEFAGTVSLPDDEEYKETALRQSDDMDLMYRAMQAARNSIPLSVVGTYTPQGPDGGAVGGTWSITVGDDDA